MIWPPHGPSLLQVEELSRIEVDPEEKTSKAHQSLVLVRGASCGMGVWIGLSFFNFPLLPCLKMFLALPHFAGCRRRWKS